MLIIVLDVAVKFQGKKSDQIPLQKGNFMYLKLKPVLFKMMHSSIWEALFMGSVSGKTWPTRACLVQNGLVFHSVGPS